MTQIYPAIRARMGRWDYFMVRMSMRELAENVKFAEEIHAATELSDAIQRVLKQSRAKGEIASYLARHEDRFFNSLVVAAIDGEPQWYPVSVEDIPEFRILRGDRRLTEAFGVLTFDGGQQYYALDGQHRLAAIRSLVEGDSEWSAPEGFRNEEVSIVIVTPRQLERIEDFMVRYRRLFGHLNRYAKNMSEFENIVMDEDDALAIITRRLVTEHPFFTSGSDQFVSSRIKMSSGKNVTFGSTHWTSLEMLYNLNIEFLNTPERRNSGWGARHDRLNDYKRFRPETEEEIDALYDELKVCWDGFIEAVPDLSEDPSCMRDHGADGENETRDNVLFWPIVQLLVVSLARDMLDEAIARQSTFGVPVRLDVTATADALRPLARINWEAHSPPWRHLLLVRNEDENWRITNESRKERLRVAERIIRWQLGLDPQSEDEIMGENGLRARWEALLPLDASGEDGSMWLEIEAGVLD
ncbi:DGQHR domain-containing protein [Candidatus Poriferisodalis sp.]|uniref:DGQHR domain-containing protein n=1 Tax=Candidatus Poriferisodalis sp. TaxID=3101277 RepID=UPI003B011D6A